MAKHDVNFDGWFDRATGGCGRTPFPYQRALAECDSLPEVLEVPTGTGKTAAAILAWLWRRQKCPAETPRRLVYCLPMRVLVEQTRGCAVRWLQNLDLLAGEATFKGERLERYRADWDTAGKVAVVTLMGGETHRDWREHPEQEQIIVGTQDMLLSRALNRGFAMAPQMWPVDFGLLNVDALWVMDEVQLMGPARTTSVQLQHFWETGPAVCAPRRTLWMSATLGATAESRDLPGWMQSPERADRPLAGPPHRHTEADLHHDEFIARWRAPKKLETHLDSSRPEAPPKKPARGKRSRSAMVASADDGRGWTVEDQELRDRIRSAAGDGRLVLVFVNQVKRARELRTRLVDGTGSADVRLVHARMRPHDRKTVEAVLQEPTPSTGRIVVTTQVLEAGSDIDADALFTEICPWPSLVQRVGRLNRNGKKPGAYDLKRGKQPAPAIVFEPPAPPQKEKEPEKEYAERRKREASLPYDAPALDESRVLLGKVAADHAGSLSPETLATLPVTLPLEGPVLRRFDLDDLFDTDPDLAGGHADVTPLLRAADRDLDAYLLWRRLDGGLPPDQQVPIHRDELCAVPFYEAQRSLGDGDVWILTLATGRKRRAAWRLARASEIRPGDTVMIDVAAGSYSEQEGWRPDASDRPTVVVDRWDAGGTLTRAWVQIAVDGSRTLIEAIDAHIVGTRAREEDWRCFGKSWMELEPHLLAAEKAADDLVKLLPLSDALRTSVTRAARWHDVGKALERDVHGETRRPFQNTLLKAGVPENGEPRSGTLYAKSNKSGGPPPGFRHELASALAFLDAHDPQDDLAAFLILAHHGKVRMLPSAWDDEEPTDLCGVRDGDRIPDVAMPSKPGQPIVLDTKKMLPSRERRSWQGRVGRLLADHGPFVLAYLEGLVRVADWRAS